MVAGVGYSQIGRSTGRSENSLAVEACMNAIADSGLPISEVDGLVTYPNRAHGAFEGPPLYQVHRSLGLTDTRVMLSLGEFAGQLSAAIVGAAHIECRLANTVVCYRAHRRQERRFATGLAANADSVTGDQALRMPYGVPGGAPRMAFLAARHMYDYGTTAEHLAEVVLTCRSNAQLNTRAVWRGHPLTLDDYYASDMVASPFRVLDCDYPVDGAVAVVLTAADRQPDLRAPAVRIEAMGQATSADADWDEWPDLTEMAASFAMRELWAHTSITPADLDVAEVYDGFSFLALAWLEAIGLCERGGSGDLVASGACRLDGRIPICTDGGQLGGGRLHGFGKLAQATMQLRGECGPAQVAGASVALACTGGGPIAAAMLLTS